VRTFVINLARRQDRRKRMESVLPAGLDVEFTTDWSGPVDGRELSLSSLAGYCLYPWRIESANPWWSRSLKWGEIGCAVSHLLCWRRGLDEGLKRFLILEDDVLFADDFIGRLEAGIEKISGIDPAWGLIYAGRYPIDEDTPFLPGIVRPGYSHCTYGYVLSNHGAQSLAHAGLEKAIVPVDEFIPAMYCDHPRLDLRRAFPKRIRAYAFEPPLVTQLPKDVAGSDTEATEFVGSD